MNIWFRNSTKQTLLSYGTFALLASIGIMSLSAPVASAEWKEGSKLPDLKHFGLEGTIPVLTGRVVVVDFWASWCGPCKTSFPLLDIIYRQFTSNGVVLLAVSVDEKAADMEKFLENHPVSFPVVRDARQRLVEAASVDGMPTSFVIDKDGVIQVVHKGFHAGKTEIELVREIESLLKKAKGAK